MFEKLNLVFPDIDYENNIGKHLNTYAKNNEVIFSNYSLNLFAKEEILKKLPNSIHSKITMVSYLCSGTTYTEIRPHIDNGVITNINYYLETADAFTDRKSTRLSSSH